MNNQVDMFFEVTPIIDGSKHLDGLLVDSLDLTIGITSDLFRSSVYYLERVVENEKIVGYSASISGTIEYNLIPNSRCIMRTMEDGKIKIYMLMSDIANILKNNPHPNELIRGKVNFFIDEIVDSLVAFGNKVRLTLDYGLKNEKVAITYNYEFIYKP